MPQDYYSIGDFNFKGKTVLIRVELNSPLNKETKIITDDSRIMAAGKTIFELVKRGAKVVVLAHQGRPGSWDFISLEQHSKLLASALKKGVKFVADVKGAEAISAIKGMSEGDIILLDNVRGVPEEMDKKIEMAKRANCDMVEKLSAVADIYVNDAFGASHRKQPSLIGFPHRLPSAAGRLLQAEIESLSRIVFNPTRPVIFIFGGAKFDDTPPLLEHLISTGKADILILAGLTGLAYLHASGVNLGASSEMISKEGDEVMKNLRATYEKYKDKIVLPADGAISKDDDREEVSIDECPCDMPLIDIGKMSIKRYSQKLKNAGTVFFSGPAGMIEKPGFEQGSRKLFEAIIESGAFTVCGGGHTASALDKFRLRDKVSYVSTGGGALETFLMGKELPVMTALKESKQKFPLVK